MEVILQKKVRVFVDDLWRLSFHFCLPANVAISDHLDCVADKNIAFQRLLDKSEADQLALKFLTSVTVLQDISDVQKSLLKTSSC